jgi:sugar O-acyltransferase (sialic acid O-acetyltransferase NeuD family)
MIASMEASGQPRFARFLDPTAIIADDAELGEGVSVLAQALVSTRARLGLHVIVNRAVQISHDCEIGDFATLAPQASLSGGVRVGAGAEIGAGALVRQGVTIGEGALVGMGAVVVKDVPPASVVIGNPARLLRTLDPFPLSSSRQSEAP